MRYNVICILNYTFFFHIYTDYPHHENTNRYFNPTRRKRHSAKRISRGVREKSVEILVVVDKYVYWKHGRQNITTYILSIFNIVSQIFVFSEFLIKQINLNWEKCTLIPRDSLCLQVSQLFQDNSLSYKVNIILVGLIILDNEEVRFIN